MPLRLSRRHVLSGMATGLLMGGHAGSAFGQAPKRIIVPEGEFTPLPIAIPNFRRGHAWRCRGRRRRGAGHHQQPQRSGLFAPIDQAAFIERITNIDTAPQFQSWKSINAQALVTGRMTRQGDGRLKAEFRLWTSTPPSSSPASNISPRRNTGGGSRTSSRPDLRNG